MTNLNTYLGQFRGDNTRLEDEYEAYLERFAIYRVGEPMGLAEFEAVLQRWDTEYEAAWEAWQGGGIPPVADALEFLLVI